MKVCPYWIIGVYLLLSAVTVSGGDNRQTTKTEPGPADFIIENLSDPGVRDLLTEVLDRNPGIAELQARMAAAGFRSTAVRKLPDPTAEVTAFVLPPETRVGPQRFAARLNQRLHCRGPDLGGVVFNPARLREVLGELAVRERDDLTVLVDRGRSNTSRARVDCNNYSTHGGNLVQRQTTSASFRRTGSPLASLPSLDRGPTLPSTGRLASEDPASAPTTTKVA